MEPGSAARPVRVAIVGGGCAALSCAYELTRPHHGGRYQVTVYQMGWRLGGKGASGRGASGRIEEHGLHLWMGFYDNAFRLMRDCYGELARDPARCRIAGWRDAFEPAPVAGVSEREAGGAWRHWVARLPPGRGLPGDPLDGANPFSIAAYLERCAVLVVELLRSARGGASEPEAPPPGTPEQVVKLIGSLLRYGELAGTAALAEGAGMLAAALRLLGRSAPQLRMLQGPLLQLIDAMAGAARQQLERLVGADAELARTWQVIDLVLAIQRGALRFGLAFDPRGFDAIDDYDWRDWLRLNGASARSLDSAFVRGIYDLVFAYEGGDPQRPRLAAGVALRGAMRMFFTYRGAMFWRMNAGMGDIVFAPLYEVLKRRGVRFEFFHRLREVRPGPGEPAYVAELDFDVQARLAGSGEYQPLVEVRGLPCWPAQPDWTQLADGEHLKAEGAALESQAETRIAGTRTLRVGADFDFVVLGTGAAVIPLVCRPLLARSARWRAVAGNLGTVPTQAFQVWLKADARSLGWPHAHTTLSAYVKPFDTWADMSHVIAAENWREPPGSIGYFCSVFPDGVATEQAQEQARRSAMDYLSRDAGGLWPKALDASGAFRWELLADAADPASTASGPARFASQYWRANVEPTERYSLSLPGSTRYRLSPLDLDFDNLSVAGDWTASGLNSGCIESAVMSGMLAAHALSQSPPLEQIVGYDHP